MLLWAKLNHLFLSLATLNIVRCRKSILGGQQDSIGCQHRSTKGGDYKGRANTTRRGIPCQKWTENQPNPFTQHLGNHSFCRNPDKSSGPWCFRSDAKDLMDYCEIPFCPSVKMLDFSLDNDWATDKNGSFSAARVQKTNLPSSFTICIAFLVESWGPYSNSPLFLLSNDNKKWMYVELNTASSFPEYLVHVSGYHFTAYSTQNFFPMQWTRVCLSFNSNNYTVILVVDGDELMREAISIEERPLDLDLIIGLGLRGQETPGKFTDINIFSTALSSIFEKMTTAGTDNCGVPGDYLNWEEEEWIVYSKARIIEVDSAKGPCRRDSKIHVFPLKEHHDHSYCMQLCEKLGGRAPPVKTFDEWQAFVEEVKHIQVEPLGLPERLWLSATEGT